MIYRRESTRRVHARSDPSPTLSPRKMEDKSQQPQSQPPSQPHAPSSFMPDMTDTPPRADVDEILRRKRKAREYKVRTHARRRAPGGLGASKSKIKSWRRSRLEELPHSAMRSGGVERAYS